MNKEVKTITVKRYFPNGGTVEIILNIHKGQGDIRMDRKTAGELIGNMFYDLTMDLLNNLVKDED